MRSRWPGVVTWTAGGLRSGRVSVRRADCGYGSTWCCRPQCLPLIRCSSRSSDPDGPGWATVNENWSPSPPATASPVTVTCSPGVKATRGCSVTPWPSRCRRNVTVWAPLTEPVTRTDRAADGSRPRNVIPVAASPSDVPGDG